MRPSILSREGRTEIHGLTMRTTPSPVKPMMFGLGAALGLVLVSGLALAGGSGYNLSYTASADSNIIPSVDLVAVSTSYSGGPNLTSSLTLAGTPVTDNSSYSYFWLFGGGATGNSTAWAYVENHTAVLHSAGLGYPPFEDINYTLSGSTLSISVNITLVGPATSFSINGEASQGDSSNTSTYSFLGTNYNGGGSCTGSSCSGSGSGSGSGSKPFPIGAIIWPVVIVVVVIVVLVLVRRRKPPVTASTAPPLTPPPSGPGSPPPPPPPPGS
jgi:hypothetical protein